MCKCILDNDAPLLSEVSFSIAPPSYYSVYKSKLNKLVKKKIVVSLSTRPARVPPVIKQGRPTLLVVAWLCVYDDTLKCHVR
jgi:hypothetical protein